MIALYGCPAGKAFLVQLDVEGRLTDFDELVPVGIYGDVNDDGVIDTTDTQQISRYLTGLPVTNVAALLHRGDVNADGAVTIIDAQQVARHVAGLSAAPLIGTICPALDTETPIGARCTIAPVAGAAFGTLRRVALAAAASGAASIIRVTPIANGAELASDAQDLIADPVDGAEQLLEAPAAANATRFQAEIAVASLGGALTLGGVALAIVPRRTTVGA